MKRSIRHGGVALALIALCLRPIAARGQDVIVITPKAVATEFLTAVTGGDWATVTRLTEEQSLWEYATQLRAMLRAWRERPPERMTIETYMKTDSLMPRVVAEYMVSQYERSFQNQLPMLSSVLADVENVAQLDSLSEEKLFVRQLRARQIGYQTTLALRRAGCSESAPASLQREPARRVRGVAILSETEAVALYEEENGIPGGKSPRGGYAQLELRRTKLGWRVVASDDTMSGASMASWVSITNCPAATVPH